MNIHGEEENQVVGYGKPPISTRYKKGKSGNPKGRPKGSGNILTALVGELQRTVSITEGGKRKRTSAAGVIAKQVVTNAAKGRLDAVRLINSIVPQQPEECERCAKFKHTSREENERIITELLAKMGAISLPSLRNYPPQELYDHVRQLLDIHDARKLKAIDSNPQG